jgi:hypothetical protein
MTAVLEGRGVSDAVAVGTRVGVETKAVTA